MRKLSLHPRGNNLRMGMALTKSHHQMLPRPHLALWWLTTMTMKVAMIKIDIGFLEFQYGYCEVVGRDAMEARSSGPLMFARREKGYASLAAPLCTRNLR
jgi:hypothetical protein